MRFKGWWDRWMVWNDRWMRLLLPGIPDDVVPRLPFLLLLLGRERVPKVEVQCQTLDRTSSFLPISWRSMRAFQTPRCNWHNVRLDAVSQVRGRCKMISEDDNLGMPAWLATSSAGAIQQALSSFTSSIRVYNVELFDPAHLTLWRTVERGALDLDEDWRLWVFGRLAMVFFKREANRTCLRGPGGCTFISMDALHKWKNAFTETTAGGPSRETCS